MDSLIAEYLNGNFIIDYEGIIFIILVGFPSHVFDKSIALWVTTVQIPSDILIACGNTVFVSASIW